MTKSTNEWTLEAIAFYGTKGADVSAIIEYIDFRNHSNYSEAKIKGALGRLAKQKRVVERQGKYFLAT